jgi:hypothetical protein
MFLCFPFKWFTPTQWKGWQCSHSQWGTQCIKRCCHLLDISQLARGRAWLGKLRIYLRPTFLIYNIFHQPFRRFLADLLSTSDSHFYCSSAALLCLGGFPASLLARTSVAVWNGLWRSLAGVDGSDGLSCRAPHRNWSGRDQHVSDSH